MEPTHEYKTKPKIAKNANSKLPDVFRMQTTNIKKKQQHPIEQKQIEQTKIDKKNEQKYNSQLVNKEKKSKNPFIPIRDFKKKMQEFQRQMKSVGRDLGYLQNHDRIGTFSNDKTNVKFRYQNCLTLSFIRRNSFGCLKKVFHVPTMTLHYLREVPISMNLDKSDLTEWINLIKMQKGSCIHPLQLFWNMPQDSYSLLYEYKEGIMLDSLNDSFYTLPQSVIKEVALAHLSNLPNLSVFNSHLLLNYSQNREFISYLPIYQQISVLNYSAKAKQIMDAQIGKQDANNSRRFSWRLGLLLMNLYLGTEIMTHQIKNIQTPLNKCCLYHQIFTTQNSLAFSFINLGQKSQKLQNFLCKCLKSKKSGQNQINLSSLINNEWIVKKITAPITMKDLIIVADPFSSGNSRIQLNKILQTISLILQNVEQLQLNISRDHQGVIQLSRQLGMQSNIDKLVQNLKRVYKIEK